MELFQKNYSSLIGINANVDETEIDLELAKLKRDASNFNDELKSWREPSNPKAIILPQLMPRSERVATSWRDESEPFRNLSEISPYIDLHEDPHTTSILSDFYFFLKENSLDPDDNLMLESAPIPGLICLGTGDGEMIKWMINTYQPFKLTIVLTRWEDIISSFWKLDWESIFDYYSRPGFTIRISRIKPDYRELLAQAAHHGLLSLDHTYIYAALSAEQELLDLKQYLLGREAQNMLIYQGYTVDEYNMLINTARFYRRGPVIYNKPTTKLADSVLVVGSGPSLDQNIEHIRQLSDSHTIICAGSNYRTLLANGICADYLVLVERADEVFDSYRSIHDEFGKTKTKLVVSSTCNDNLCELFDDVCIFFRPALTPICLFGENDQQIISHEGPQAVCAAVSFALNFNPQRLVFIGVDLGAKNPEEPRTKSAIGYSPRDLTHKTQGNLSMEVYTDTRLLDCKEMLESRIDSIPGDTQITIINCSDGVLINGAQPMEPSQYVQTYGSNDSNLLTEQMLWWSSLEKATAEKAASMLKLRQTREKTLRLTDRLRTLISDDKIHWFPTLVSNLDHMLDHTQLSYADQVPVRIIKSSILKAAVSVSQQFHILNKNPDLKNLHIAFGDYAKKRILGMIDRFEKEIYMVLDYIDDLLEIS
jgi:hypothetical protein